MQHNAIVLIVPFILLQLSSKLKIFPKSLISSTSILSNSFLFNLKLAFLRFSLQRKIIAMRDSIFHNECTHS